MEKPREITFLLQKKKIEFLQKSNEEICRVVFHLNYRASRVS